MGEFAAMVAAISLLAALSLMCLLIRLAVKSMGLQGGEVRAKIAAGIFRVEFGAKINSALGVGDTNQSEVGTRERIEPTAPPKVIEQGEKKPGIASGGGT